MRKFSLAILILCLVLSFVGLAFSKEDSEITFKGNLTIVQNGKELKVKNAKNISIPKLTGFETQDEHPFVMAKVFNETGYAKSKPVITVKTSKPFTLSCNRISGIFYMGEDYIVDELQPCLLQVGGEKSPFKIPATTRDYYVQVEMSEKEYEEYVKENGYEDEDGEMVIDAAVIQYFKMRVTK